MLYKCTVCDSRHDDPIPAAPGCFVACTIRSCGGECERCSICLRCKDNDALHDGDYCASCYADDAVANPAELENFTQRTRDQVSRVLAARLRVIDLLRKQAH